MFAPLTLWQLNMLLTCLAYLNWLVNSNIAHRIILTTDRSHLNVNQRETETGDPLIILLSIYIFSMIKTENK